MMLQRKLKQKGFTVLGNASTKDKAISMYRDLKPDLILMDIHLANSSSGIEAAIEIKRENPNLPIIYITAYDDEGTKTKALSTEPIAFLTKPLSIEHLIALVGEQYSR